MLLLLLLLFSFDVCVEGNGDVVVVVVVVDAIVSCCCCYYYFHFHSKFCTINFAFFSISKLKVTACIQGHPYNNKQTAITQMNIIIFVLYFFIHSFRIVSFQQQQIMRNTKKKYCNKFIHVFVVVRKKVQLLFILLNIR